MDKDVEAKLQKLCNQYLTVESQLNLLRPSKLPTAKQHRRAQNQAAKVLRELRDARRPVAGAMVRLAYVRAMRGVMPTAKLGPEQEVELASLESQLNRHLRHHENQAWRSLAGHVRRLKVADQMDTFGYPEETTSIMGQGAAPFPLEQCARECAVSIIQMATAAGSLAASSYDEHRNAA